MICGMATYAYKGIGKNELVFPIVFMSSADFEPVRIVKQTFPRKIILIKS